MLTKMDFISHACYSAAISFAQMLLVKTFFLLKYTNSIGKTINAFNFFTILNECNCNFIESICMQIICESIYTFMRMKFEFGKISQPCSMGIYTNTCIGIISYVYSIWWSIHNTANVKTLLLSAISIDHIIICTQNLKRTLMG